MFKSPPRRQPSGQESRRQETRIRPISVKRAQARERRPVLPVGAFTPASRPTGPRNRHDRVLPYTPPVMKAQFADGAPRGAQATTCQATPSLSQINDTHFVTLGGASQGGRYREGNHAATYRHLPMRRAQASACRPLVGIARERETRVTPRVEMVRQEPRPYSATRTAASWARSSSFPGASTNVSNSRK